MSLAHLAKLNPEQRRAVEHGVRDGACARPVRSSSSPVPDRAKPTHWPRRVAHLIVLGADPRRMMLTDLFPPRRC